MSLEKSSKSATVKSLKGIVFDLDGTLVDSQLDFEAMRAEIGIPGEQGLLEYIESLDSEPEKKRAHEIILKHEYRGAECATLISGVEVLLRKIDSHGLRRSIFTRNERGPVELTLKKLSLTGFDPVITRDDALPKPHPEGLYNTCKAWQCSTEEVLIIGDYKFDLEAGKAAKMKTIWYAPEGSMEFSALADLVVNDLGRFAEDFEKEINKSLGYARL